jgi:hypothetical protein
MSPTFLAASNYLAVYKVAVLKIFHEKYAKGIRKGRKNIFCGFEGVFLAGLA